MAPPSAAWLRIPQERDRLAGSLPDLGQQAQGGVRCPRDSVGADIQGLLSNVLLDQAVGFSPEAIIRVSLNPLASFVARRAPDREQEATPVGRLEQARQGVLPASQ